jgi:predicted N-formylglutamate amidohydrolase
VQRRGTARRRLHGIVTCEHGGNRVPAAYAPWFAQAAALLASHRGYDPGALALGRALAARLHAPLHFTTVSRLVVEQNRSPGHRQLFSAMMLRAPAALREDALRRYYLPYHRAVAGDVEQAIGEGARVLHISAHSFAPVLRGDVRRTDVGLLYDPAHAPEAAFCLALQHALRRHTQRRVRLNYPYRGTSDGFTTRLRRRHAPGAYLGVEVEVNQRLVRAAGWTWLRGALAEGFADAVAALSDGLAGAVAGRADGHAEVVAAPADDADGHADRPAGPGPVTPPRAARESAPRSPAIPPAPVPRAARRAGR